MSTDMKKWLALLVPLIAFLTVLFEEGWEEVAATVGVGASAGLMYAYFTPISDRLRAVYHVLLSVTVALVIVVMGAVDLVNDGGIDLLAAMALFVPLLISTDALERVLDRYYPGGS